MVLYNTTIPRLEKAFELIANGDVVLLESYKAVVHGSKPYHVNYSLETCECYDHVESGHKCKHIWAAQLRRQQLLEEAQ
jgi:uncharacterized Zn finger protein